MTDEGLLVLYNQLHENEEYLAYMRFCVSEM